MRDIIHARKNDKGGVVFRLWSTCTDSYSTPPMTETVLREYLHEEPNPNTTENNAKIEKRIERAKKNGTSSLMPGDNRKLDAPWEKELGG